MSAATHELKRGGGRSLTRRFDDARSHLGIDRVRRINPGKSNENGAAESRHNRTKKMLAQALQLRGSSDFDSVEAYEAFVAETLERRHNRHRAANLDEERPHLRPLPSTRLPSYTVSYPKVRKWSTLSVAKRMYSVHSRLIGHQAKAEVPMAMLDGNGTMVAGTADLLLEGVVPRSLWITSAGGGQTRSCGSTRIRWPGSWGATRRWLRG